MVDTLLLTVGVVLRDVTLFLTPVLVVVFVAVVALLVVTLSAVGAGFAVTVVLLAGFAVSFTTAELVVAVVRLVFAVLTVSADLVCTVLLSVLRTFVLVVTFSLVLFVDAYNADPSLLRSGREYVFL